MTLIYNLGKKTAYRNKHAISHSASKFGTWFGKMSGKLIRKILNLPFQSVGSFSKVGLKKSSLLFDNFDYIPRFYSSVN